MNRQTIQRVVAEMTTTLKADTTSPALAKQIEEWRNSICVATDTRIPA